MSAAVSSVLLTLDALDPLPVDTVCLFVSEDERPLGGAAGFVDWRLCGQLSRLLVDGFFKGTRGESLLLPSNGRIGAPRLVVLGLGPGGGNPDWGAMFNDAVNNFRLQPWLAVGPGLAIFLSVLSFFMLGDDLRDLLDPRERGRHT